MALKGDLASVDLAQVFQMLALNQKAGILSIFTTSTWKALFFDQRGVTLHYNPYTFPDRVLEHLVRAGRLQEEKVQEAKDYLKTRGGTLEEALARMGAMGGEEFRREFSRQIEDEVYDLFFWHDARFEFLEGATEVPGKEGAIDENFFFNPDSVIMEAARRMDEWSVIRERIQDSSEVFGPAGELAGTQVLDLDDMALNVLDLVDGKRSVARIVEITGCSSFHVFKALATLCDRGQVRLLEPQELAANALECLSEGRMADGLNLLEKAAEAGIGGQEAHLTAAKAYQSLDELEKAAGHYKTYIEGLVAAGNLEEAISLLSEVIGLIPTDLRARERLLDLATQDGADLRKIRFDPLAEGRTLIDIYVEMGEFDRARAVVERLLEIQPGDLELMKSLVGIHSRAGDTRRVLELYEVMAGELLRRKDLMGAIKFLQKILLIDKERKDVSERIRQLYLQEERARSRRRGITTLIGAGVCLFLLAGLYSWYEVNSRKAFEGIEPAPYLEERNFAGAIGLYENFLRRYPLSLLRARAHERIAGLKAKEAAWVEQEEAARLRLEMERERRREAYQRHHRRYEELLRGEQKDLSAALAELGEAERLVRENGQKDDLAWARGVGLESNLADLRSYLEGAERLSESVGRSLQANNYRAAYLQARELLSKYSLSPLARTFEVPIRLVSRPEGAEVFFGGKPWFLEGRAVTTPCTVPVRPGCKVELELRKDGYRPEVRTLTVESQSPLKISMGPVPLAQTPLPGQPARGGAADGQRLLAALSGGRLVCIARGAGLLLWEAKLPGLLEVVAGPVISGDGVYIGTSGKSARCHDLATGRELWSVPLTGEIEAAPLPLPRGILFATTAGQVVLLEPLTGRTIWRTATAAGVHAAPALRGRQLFVPLASGQVAVLDADSGARGETFQAGGSIRSTPLLTADRLLAAATDGKVYGFPLDGRGRPWIFFHGVSLRHAALVDLGGGALLVGRDDGRLFRLDSGGEPTCEFDLQACLAGGPILVGKRIYVAVSERGGGDRLLCVDSETLIPNWEYPFQGPVVAPLTVLPDALLITCSDRNVYEFP